MQQSNKPGKRGPKGLRLAIPEEDVEGVVEELLRQPKNARRPTVKRKKLRPRGRSAPKAK